MKTLKTIPLEASNSELENNEVVFNLDGRTHKVTGKLHSEGGINMVLSEGSKIFSQKLKAEKDLVKNLVGKDKKLSFAKMAEMYDTHEELRDLMDNKSDDLSKKTSQLMLTKKLAQLDSIFEAQESQKEMTSNNTLNDIISSADKKIMKYGGKFENPKYQNGAVVDFGLKDINGKPIVNTKFTMDGLLDKTLAPYVGKGYLSDHPFITTGLSQLSMTYNPSKNTFNYKGDKERADKLIKEYPDIYKNYNDVYNVIKDYQAKSIHLNPDGTYEQTPDAIAHRNEVYKHYKVDTNENWGYQEFNPFTNEQGVQDIKFKDYADGHNRMNQVGFLEQRNPLDVIVPINKGMATYNPLIKNNRPTSNPLLPNKESIVPVNNKPTIPTGQDYLKDVYQMAAIRDMSDLATLKAKTPAYNYTPQNIAYQRFLPQNTLAAERQFNLQKEQLENSNLPENVKSAYLSDLYAKFQDTNSEIQLRNLQGDNANDNNNVNLYNQITDRNRQEKIQYDDNFRKLVDITEGKYSQEKLRLQDQLINNYSKFKQDKQNRDLLNSMSEGFYFDGTQVRMIPGYKPRDINDPTAAYQNNQMSIAAKFADVIRNPSAYTEMEYKAAAEYFTKNK